jgi:hypothetical protein
MQPRRLVRSLALLLGACLVPAAASAADHTLQNDTFVSGGNAAFQGGFAAGEIAASRFVPPGPFPMPLKEVLFLFGGSTAQRTIVLHVWNDGGAVDPGTEIYSNAYQVTGSDVAFQQIDLSGENVTVSGPFRVGIEMTASGYPSVARDVDGTIDPTANFIQAQVSSFYFWFRSQDLGLTGDWILRAVVSDPAGMDATATPVAMTPRIYPNPFARGTAVTFSTSRPEPATVTVFDVAGRAVRTLASGPMDAGPHVLPWDGRDDRGRPVPAGVYFLRVDAADVGHTGKVVRLSD